MKHFGLALVASALLVTGCANHAQSDNVSGSVSYRERIALPPGSVVKVALQDTSKQDVAADTLAEAVYTINGAPPYPFELTYDADQLKPGHSYTLSARIEGPHGQLMFINTTVENAFDGDGNNMTLQLVAHEQAPDLPLKDTHWILSHIQGQPAPLGMQDKAANLVVNQDGVAAGFSGCNRFHGRYLDDSGMIAAGPMAATMMACPQGMELEREYLAHLSQTTTYEIKGNTLSLMDNNGTELLRFISQ
ncbi:YbaY family lipoprotein [Ferrimonas futtsuensis]|uniref:YbaY family lipoprotein n=1 Tax=Ferrimonas futtsuensis TaxID=364764 RepID=UPI0004022B4C|nr:YbaY family lipoprotein [Ferrimonas futtsuensis]